MHDKFRLGLLGAALSLGLVATSAPAATALLPEWRTDPASQRTTAGPDARVVGLRMAEHPGFDRVVIDMRGRAAGYDIRYTARLTYDGSGAPVRLKGRKKVALVIHGARAHTLDGENLYTGPRRRQVDLPTLRGVALTGDFEGQVSFGFATSRRAPYRIFVLKNPARIVVDWRH